jgi:predicted MFS family arabinose efflux permease
MAGVRDVLRVLQHADFRRLWLAQSASVVGDRIVTVALALFVIDLTGSPTDLGLVLAAHAMPLVGFLLIGGVWADRLPRHRVMIATDLARFALHAILAVLIISGEVRIWQVAAIEVLFGSAEAFFRPAASGLLPQTVPEAEIQEANAITTMFGNIAEFIGPALATALVLGVGAGAAFAVDAGTFLISAAFLSRVRPRRRGVPPVAAARGTVWREVREGFDEVRSRSWVWVTLAVFCVAVFVAFAPWSVLGPSVARTHYGSIGIYGLVAAGMGAGTIAGSLIGIRWRPRYPMRLGMLFVLLWPVATVLFAAGVSLLIVVPAMVSAGAGFALFDVWWLTALAERIPPDKLSRVTSYDWMVSLGLLPVGYLLVGPLASAFGAVVVLLTGAILALLVLALGLLPHQTRMLERVGAEGVAPPLAERHPGVPVA